MADKLLIAKTRLMLELQDEMNRKVDPDWMDQGREWYRAIWLECGELIEHYGGWKWWKHAGEPDAEQVLLEIVDIWHFGLSLRITPERDYAAIAKAVVADWNRPIESQGFLQDVEDLACVALVEEKFEVSVIPVLLGQIKCDFNDLYRAYVGKNVLNFFRQDHGYKDGSYQKQWGGREDNEHLSEVLAELDSDSDSFREDVYTALETRYGAGADPQAGTG